MAIELEIQTPELKIYRGSGSFILASGKELKIETSPDGEDILEFTADANYDVSIYVSFREKEA